jgi:hypothetical protein
LRLSPVARPAEDNPDPSLSAAPVVRIRVGLAPLGLQFVYQPPETTRVPVRSVVTLHLLVPAPSDATVKWFNDAAIEPVGVGAEYTLAPGELLGETLKTYVALAYAADDSVVASYGVRLTAFAPQCTSRLLNNSTRATLTPASPRLIGGIVVSEQRSYAVLVRAVGPALAGLGVDHPLPDPVLRFFDAEGKSADGYILSVVVQVIGVPSIQDLIEFAGVRVGAFPLPSGGADIAHLVIFPPGAFTTHVTSASGASGDVLLECYDVPLDLLVGASFPAESIRTGSLEPATQHARALRHTGNTSAAVLLNGGAFSGTSSSLQALGEAAARAINVRCWAAARCCAPAGPSACSRPSL